MAEDEIVPPFNDELLKEIKKREEQKREEHKRDLENQGKILRKVSSTLARIAMTGK
jgi:hypothetical protein